MRPRAHMRPFGLPTLIMGAVLSAFAVSSAGQWALADSIEPVTLEAENGTPAICNSDDISVYVPQPSSTSESPCPAHARETGKTARARAYLIATATPGYTMTRQGPERAIGRLHPQFVNRLAAPLLRHEGRGCRSRAFSRLTGHLHSASAASSTSSTRSIPMASPSMSLGLAGLARQKLCSGTRSPHDTA
jgi:hypothetical protein